jgi:hypothetical protein
MGLLVPNISVNPDLCKRGSAPLAQAGSLGHSVPFVLGVGIYLVHRQVERRIDQIGKL